MLRIIPAVLVVTLLAGCFPVELSVTQNGEIVIPREEGVLLYHPGRKVARLVKTEGPSEQPAFAVASPDGSKLLWASTIRSENSAPGTQSRLLVTDLATGVSEEIAVVEYAAFLQWAPDGRSISYAYFNQSGVEGLTEGMPEIRIMRLEDRSERVVSRNSSALHRWTPDGKAIVFIKTLSKDEDGTRQEITAWNTATGRAEIKLPVRNADWLELSPSGNDVIVSATFGEEKSLAIISLTNGDSRIAGYDAAFARYSPDGNHIVVQKDNGYWLADRALMLPSAQFAVAEELKDVKFLPTWLPGNELLIFCKKATYGASVFVYQLAAINPETGEMRVLQDDIEAALRK